MIKKYVIAVDSNCRFGQLEDEVRIFIFGKKNMYDTVEKAEDKIKELIENEDKNSNRPVFWSILPIYTKN